MCIRDSSNADLSQIFQVAKQISLSINKFKIIVTKSTVPVKTGDEIEKILLKKKSNKNKFSVVSNPEFLREGEAIRDFIFPDRIVVGSNDKKSNRAMNNLYAPLISKGAQYIHTSRRAAELIKYASNAFLATKITFINEIANLCEKTGINVEDISIGMGLDKRIGSRFLRAGPGYGGSCFPKDTKAITSTADKFKINLSDKISDGVINAIDSNIDKQVILSNKELTSSKEIQLSYLDEASSNKSHCIRPEKLSDVKYHSLIVELNEPNSMMDPIFIISMTNDFHDSSAWGPIR